MNSIPYRKTNRMFNALRIGMAVAAAAALVPAHAWMSTPSGLASPASVPLSSSSTSSVLPNVLLLLDNSGSMDWDFMPDDQVNGNNNPALYNSSVGLRNHRCNYSYYNPAVSYTIPKGADGNYLNTYSGVPPATTGLVQGGSSSNPYAGAQTTFTAAITNGYWWYMGQTRNTVDLSTSFRAQSVLNSGSFPADTAQEAHYWVYLGTGTLDPSSKTTGDCGWRVSTSSPQSSTLSTASATGICNDGTVVTNSPASCTAPKTLIWRKVIVNTTSGPGATDERQNFANWYTYYRTRILMMKSAGSRAFAQLTIIPPKYRTGFLTINPGSPVSATTSDSSIGKFLPINVFQTTHRARWFKTLFNQDPSGGTPLREALSRAGRYFAHKTTGINAGMSDDPIEYSCQQNFTILVTDGYWNGNAGNDLNGNTLNTSQDSNTAEKDAYNLFPGPPIVDKRIPVSIRPFFDGANVSVTATDKSNAYRQRSGYPTSSNTGCSSGRKYTYQFQYCTTTTSTSTIYEDATLGNIVSGPTTTLSPSGACTSWNTASWLTYTSGCLSSPPGWPATPPAGRPNYVTYPSAQPALPSGCTAWPCTGAPTTSGGSSDSLADVAQYYYKTDLRACDWDQLTTAAQQATGKTETQYCKDSFSACTGAIAAENVCANNIKGIGSTEEDDRANWQHMTTFTMGLGLSGTLPYRSDYKTATSGAYKDIKDGAGTTPNWPPPTENSKTALDDLWHTAVNGRGTYFSAGEPDTVVNGLVSALSSINSRTASAAAAATSNLEPVEGDNFAFLPKYRTMQWYGEVEAHEFDLNTGNVKPEIIWSAQAKLDAMTGSACDNRTIKLFRSGATDNMVDFAWNSKACDSSMLPTGTAKDTLNSTEKAYFSAAAIAANLSQWSDMTDGSGGTADQRTAAAGENLVNFLRGYRGKEGYVRNDINRLYREATPASDNGDRPHLLGDVVNAKPLFVKRVPFNYEDPGYSAFQTLNNSTTPRAPMVYVAANDGMLHAFYAGTSAADPQGGREAWAFMPSSVLPNLHVLASKNYPNQHLFSVDGTPVQGNVFDRTASADCAAATPSAPESCWKTILVAGLNSGGKGYYALDITNPAAPKALWEFKHSSTCFDPTSALTIAATGGADCHIGYTYGNPIISKLADGTWVVFVTSGIDNVNTPAIAGDGIGYLYVLNAITGKIIYKIATGVGNSATPSGLNHIKGYGENPDRNNTALRIYGVDLLGNIWRFDVNDLLPPAGREATLLAHVTDPDGIPQPMTTAPVLADLGGVPYVFVATGKFISTSDKSDTQKQTVYAFADDLTSTAIPNVRTGSLRRITLTDVGSSISFSRSASCTAFCGATRGWFADLPIPGERVNVDIKEQDATLVVGSNVPTDSGCSIGGYSIRNAFDTYTGLGVAGTDGVVGVFLSNSLVVGLNIIRLPSGKTVVVATTSDAETKPIDTPFNTPPPDGRRVSWREIY